ncbi:MAG: anion permease, partial [Selenomonas bovis]|nr:anion permease [Selenomonas bovis]
MKKKIGLMGLPLGILVLIAIMALPTPPELSTAGHRMLAILVFSVVIWMTEAVSYPVSSGIIMSLMAFLLGTAPNMSNPSKMLGTSGALKMALAGFSSTALAL